MLWHVRIPLRQMLILIGKFSVTVVAIITAIRHNPSHHYQP